MNNTTYPIIAGLDARMTASCKPAARDAILVPASQDDGRVALRCSACDRVVAVFRRAAQDGHHAAEALAALRSALRSHRC